MSKATNPIQRGGTESQFTMSVSHCVLLRQRLHNADLVFMGGV